MIEYKPKVNLNPGKHLDSLIAKHVVKDYYKARDRDYYIKDYSTKMSVAWEIVEQYRTPNMVFSLVTALFTDTKELKWVATWEMHNPEYTAQNGISDTPAHAICLATLKALGHEFE